MPDNFDEPSHRLMRDVAAGGPWAPRLQAASSRLSVLKPAVYYDLLAPLASGVDVWRTVYYHPMDSAAAIVDWVSATGLRPFTDPLDSAERPVFLARYQAAIAEAYPAQADGRRLLRFPRLFVVAQRGD